MPASAVKLGMASRGILAGEKAACRSSAGMILAGPINGWGGGVLCVELGEEKLGTRWRLALSLKSEKSSSSMPGGTCDREMVTMGAYNRRPAPKGVEFWRRIHAISKRACGACADAHLW